MRIQTAFLEKVEEFSNEGMKKEAELTNPQCTNGPLRLFQKSVSIRMEIWEVYCHSDIEYYG